MSFVTVLAFGVKNHQGSLIVKSVTGHGDNMAQADAIALSHLTAKIRFHTHGTPNYEALNRLWSNVHTCDQAIFAINRMEGVYVHRYGFTLPFDV